MFIRTLPRPLPCISLLTAMSSMWPTLLQPLRNLGSVKTVPVATSLLSSFSSVMTMMKYVSLCSRSSAKRRSNAPAPMSGELVKTASKSNKPWSSDLSGRTLSPAGTFDALVPSSSAASKSAVMVGRQEQDVVAVLRSP